LRLRDFRNFAELELSFPPEGVALIGDNGEGKTNLVEALYYLEIFRSFRGAPDEQLVRRGAEAFHLRGRFAELAGGAAEGAAESVMPGAPGGALREVAVGYERRTRRKRVAIDGAEPERIGDALGGVGAVVFSPSDLAIVTGSPGERRRFLDIVLSLNAPGYLAALQRYRQVLKQRNALLRDNAGPSLLASWDEGLVEWGSRVIVARQSWIIARDPGFVRRYTAIAGGTAGRMIYQPAVPLPGGDGPASIEEVADAFHAELARVARRERERGITLTGPHRDDLLFVMEGMDTWVDLRDFGSGGQQRTAAIVLRMVEAETVREARGREPIILLDDIFAELDPGRSHRILELLEAEERGQVILTAPKASDLEVRRGLIPHWRLANGKVFS
jgi:DNA replication and repair protein RecF